MYSAAMFLHCILYDAALLIYLLYYVDEARLFFLLWRLDPTGIFFLPLGIFDILIEPLDFRFWIKKYKLRGKARELEQLKTFWKRWTKWEGAPPNVNPYCSGAGVGVELEWGSVHRPVRLNRRGSNGSPVCSQLMCEQGRKLFHWERQSQQIAVG